MTTDRASLKPQPRSWLFVPANDERKLAKAQRSEADALLIDLEDSVAPDAKTGARQTAADFLGSHGGQSGPALYVRVNDLGTGLTRGDLEAVLSRRPAGIMLPKVNSRNDVATCADLIAQIAGGATAEDIAIIAIATETPLALLQMHTFAEPHPRLDGLAWGAEDLSAELGASSARDASGDFTSPFMLARNLCLFAAHACRAQPIDSIHADFRDEAGLRREAEEAARDGFTGKMAIHPAQIPAINEAFTPSPETLAEAKAIVDAFAANPGMGTIGLNGRMIDRPHLTRSLRLLARAGQKAR
jgi:citrate lyase subunit beta/citryl-CoA lyase